MSAQIKENKRWHKYCNAFSNSNDVCMNIMDFVYLFICLFFRWISSQHWLGEEQKHMRMDVIDGVSTLQFDHFEYLLCMHKSNSCNFWQKKATSHKVEQVAANIECRVYGAVLRLLQHKINKLYYWLHVYLCEFVCVCMYVCGLSYGRPYITTQYYAMLTRSL